jgi:hypothetical protein
VTVGPTENGPQAGEWDPALMYRLGLLQRAASRAIDAAQVGGPLPEGFLPLAEQVLEEARAYGVSRRAGGSSPA